ncbi:MAG: ankyrin repeat domain-containing protein [Candidatus Eremiobacteraeota bacterium]|nr:ankyrin repeat domain-containing protein [Candidatus Eremiobacteraeota bacterium]
MTEKNGSVKCPHCGDTNLFSGKESKIQCEFCGAFFSTSVEKTVNLTCPECAGEGKVKCPRCRGDGQAEIKCATCRGTGLNPLITWKDSPCVVCGGSKTELEPCSCGSGQVKCEFCSGRGRFGSAGELQERLSEKKAASTIREKEKERRSSREFLLLGVFGMVTIIIIVFALLGSSANIHNAVYSGDRQKVAALIEKDPSLVNKRDDLSKTPLHKAAEQGFTSIAEYLLSKGADIDARDSFGKTPLDYARAGDNTELIRLLESAKSSRSGPSR